MIETSPTEQNEIQALWTRMSSLRDRMIVATPAPWYPELVQDGTEDGPESTASPTGRIFVAPDLTQDYDHEDDLMATTERGADAQFIAAARTDVPWLLSALDAVLDLHGRDDRGECETCRLGERGLSGQAWPCETVRAILDTPDLTEGGEV